MTSTVDQAAEVIALALFRRWGDEAIHDADPIAQALSDANLLAPAVGWRPIAEHDGSEGPFDLWRNGERLTEFYWRRGHWERQHGYPASTTVLTVGPSHFRALPTPPEGTPDER